MLCIRLKKLQNSSYGDNSEKQELDFRHIKY